MSKKSGYRDGFLAGQVSARQEATEAKNEQLEARIKQLTALPAPPAPVAPAEPPPPPRTHRQVHAELQRTNPYLAAQYLLNHAGHLDASAPAQS
jgi:hypothetical protein